MTDSKERKLAREITRMIREAEREVNRVGAERAGHVYWSALMSIKRRLEYVE
jgi:hypothetical protein